MPLTRRIMDIVSNRYAGGNIGRPLKLSRLKTRLGHWGKVHSPPTPEAIRRCVEDAKRAGVVFLGLDGGDGTTQLTLTELFRVYGPTGPYPKIIFLRAGSMETIPTALGAMTGSWEEILGHVQEKLRVNASFTTGRARVMKINDEYGFIFGLGLVERLLKEHYRRPQGSRGPSQAALLVLKIVGSTFWGGELADRLGRASFAAVKTSTSETSGFYTAVMASTIEKIGLGFAPMKRLRRNPGCFMVIASRLQLAELIRNLPRIWRGEHLPNTFENFTETARIDFAEPTRYVVDGEIKGPTQRVCLDIGPEIEFIRY